MIPSKISFSYLLLFQILLLSATISADSNFKYEKIYKKNTYIFEQHLQTDLEVPYPTSNLKGIYNYAITEYQQPKNSTISNKTISNPSETVQTEAKCELSPDLVYESADSTFINLSDLDKNIPASTKILAMGVFNFLDDQTVYLFTSTKDILQVSLDPTPELTSKLSLSKIFTDQLQSNTKVTIISSEYSHRLYVVYKTFIASKVISQDDTFSSSEFEVEQVFIPRKKIFHVNTFDKYLAVSCGDEGIDFYVIGEDGRLGAVFHQFQKGSEILQTEYNSEKKTVAFLNQTGIHFIKILENKIISENAYNMFIPYFGGVSFSHDRFQTFWVLSENEVQTTEIVADINKGQLEDNRAYLSKAIMVGTYLGEDFGILFNKQEYQIYLHSIPHSAVSNRRDKIGKKQYKLREGYVYYGFTLSFLNNSKARFALEDTKAFKVIEDTSADSSGRLRILAITDKTLNVHELGVQLPVFHCSASKTNNYNLFFLAYFTELCCFGSSFCPGEEPGTYKYKVRIQSKECEAAWNNSNGALFNQCVIEDDITVNVNRSYMTSSDQKAAIWAAIGSVLFFALLIITLWVCYKNKKKILETMEDKARELRKIKYMQLQEKGQVSSQNEHGV